MQPVVITNVNTFNVNGKPESQALIVTDEQLAHIHKALNFMEWADADYNTDLHSCIIGPIEAHLCKVTLGSTGE